MLARKGNYTSRHFTNTKAKRLGGRHLASTLATLLLLLAIISRPAGGMSVSFAQDHPLNPNVTLAYSTYLGGLLSDGGNSIAVDAAGNIYIAGTTNSTNFPTANAFQATLNGPGDAFVAKFNPTGTMLIFSTYLGGSGGDSAMGITVDSAGNSYVTGSTTSTNFPLANAFQATYGGGNGDAFVTKLNAAGSALVYSTYLGGSDFEAGGADIAVDSASNVYVTGWTNSTNFPTANAYQPNLSGPQDVYITKFNSAGSALVYSTYLGGSGQEGFSGTGAIAVDASGNAYVSNVTSSLNFPTVNAYQPSHGGAFFDAFVTKLNPSGSAPIYSTYLGGNDWEYSYGEIAADGDGNAYVTGSTRSTNFPTANAYQPNLNGFNDVYVTKFNSTGSALVYSTYLGGSGDETGTGIAVDSMNNAYVAGSTRSTDFPLVDPFQPTHGGGTCNEFPCSDAFVTKFNASGTALLYSSYLGGGGADSAYSMAIDGANNAFITGNTESMNFPVVNPFQPNYAGGTSDAFVSKISGQQGTPTPTRTPVPPSATVTHTSTVTTATTQATSTATPTSAPPTSTAWVTNTPTATNTVMATATQAPCTLSFTDVDENNTFYANIRCLACRGIISGYADGTFKPNNLVTRGQLAKIVSNAAGFTESPDPQIFEDVPSSNTFYQWINRLARRGHMSGYACGGVGEPCTTGMPYFRPFANATRGQTSKIVANAAGYSDIPTDQTFEDVPPTHTFYNEIQRLASRNIMQGYSCGGTGEPCLTGKPYFRPANNVTRGQSAKIVANTFYPGCTSP